MLLRVALPPQRALVECFPLLLLPVACFGHGHPRVLVFDGHMHHGLGPWVCAHCVVVAHV